MFRCVSEVCEVSATTTTQPSSAWRRSAASTWCSCAASSPALSSSTTSSVGLVISSIAIDANRRRSGANLSIRVPRCGDSPSSSSTWSTTRLRCSAEVSGGSRSRAAYPTARSTVRLGCARSSADTIPMRARINPGSACTSCSSTVTVPKVGSRAPASRPSSAELLAADGPTTAVNVPGRAVNDTLVSSSWPSAVSPSQCAATPTVRAPGFNGNRLVVFGSAAWGAGEETTGSFVVLIRSISLWLSGGGEAGAGAGGRGWDVGIRIRWVVLCVGACGLGLGGGSGAGGGTAGPTPRIKRGPRRGSPMVID